MEVTVVDNIITDIHSELKWLILHFIYIKTIYKKICYWIINITRKTVKFMKNIVYIMHIIRRFPLLYMCISKSSMKMQQK